MKKRVHLSKNAMYLIGFIILILMVFVVIRFGSGSDDSSKVETKESTVEALVTENQVLKVELLDFISEKSYDDKYQEVSLKIEKGEEIAGIEISQEQKFNKIMQLLPPDENSPLLNKEKATHNAYILVLVGDIAKYKDKEGKESYKIVNSRLNYYKQTLFLETDFNSVYIASIDGQKEKMVKLPTYKETLSDVTKYMTMLQW